MPVDLTLYELKKEAARFFPHSYSKPINYFDVLLNGSRITDQTLKLCELIHNSYSVVEVVEKDESRSDIMHLEEKTPFIINWEGVSYNVSISKKATILDLKNKIT